MRNDQSARHDPDAKYEDLERILRDLKSVCIGYSGGVDSVFLARVATEVLGPANVLAVTGLGPAFPRAQREVAADCAGRFGIPHLEIETHEIRNPNYAANPVNRCYFCKTELWTRLRAVAEERGLDHVVDGANADDAADYRPGAQAARELGVRSPLAEAGFTKADVRRWSRTLGLPTWDQPASPCLASRIVYGLSVTPGRLRQIEAAEDALRDMGFREFRVRHHGDVARIELAPAELPAGLARAAAMAGALAGLGFARVLLDVEGYRRGALNEGLVPARVGAVS